MVITPGPVSAHAGPGYGSHADERETSRPGTEPFPPLVRDRCHCSWTIPAIHSLPARASLHARVQRRADSTAMAHGRSKNSVNGPSLLFGRASGSRSTPPTSSNAPGRSRRTCICTPGSASALGHGHTPDSVVDPAVSLRPDAQAARRTAQWVRERFGDGVRRARFRVETCVYTSTADDRFLIQRSDPRLS